MIQERGELVAQAVIGSGGRLGLARLTGQAGGKLQGAANIGQAHVFEIHFIQALEIALGHVEDGLGEQELALAKGLLAVGGLKLLRLARLDELFGGEGAVAVEATAPVELAGPGFNGAQGDAAGARDGGIAPRRTELELGAEGCKGPG